MGVKTILLAIGLGLISSTALLAIVLLLQISWLIGFVVLSGTPTATFLFWALPSGLVYSIVPEGGGPATVLLFTFSAWLQFVALFSVVFYILLKRRSNKALNPDARQQPRAG